MKKLIILIFVFLSHTVSAEVDLASEIKQLINIGENDFFVHVGESTKNKLRSLKSHLNECSVIIEQGDAGKPIGNGEATETAYIKCKDEKTIGLRLKNDNDSHYHILGFWTF